MSDSPITAIALHHIALPTRREHKWTGLTEPIGGYVLVQMTDAAGAVGWGEAPALKDWGGEFGRYFGESPATTIEVVTRHLAPAVQGCMPGEIAELHARMDRAIKGYPYAKAAVEFAAYDLAGRQWGLPVHRLLGGAVRRRIPVTHSIGLIGPEEAEREVAQVTREGIRTIKIKVGVDPDRDVDMVRRIRETVGPGIALCIDANQGYRTPGEAIRAFRRMERFELIYFEQPVEGIDRLAQVARAVDAPVMADESAWNAHDVIEIIEKRAAQIVSIYTTKPGGLYHAMEVAAVARAAGSSATSTARSRPASAISPISSWRRRRRPVLSCVVPVSTPAEAQSGQLAGIYYQDDLIARPMRLVDGAIDLPDGAGMGIAADAAKIARYQRRRKRVGNAAGCDRAPGSRHAEAGLDAVVAISPENFAYVTGFLSPTQPLMRWRHAMALVTADGAAALAVVDMEASTIRAKSPAGTEIAVWREFQLDAMDVLAALLRRHGLANARIGIEMDYLPAGDFAALRGSCRRRISRPRRPCWRGCARSRRRKRSTSCAGCRTSPTGRSPRLTALSPPARARWTSPRRSPAASTSRVRNISSS